MEPTVEVLLEVSERVHAVILPHADRKPGFVVVVHQTLHQDLLVGPAGPNLQSF